MKKNRFTSRPWYPHAVAACIAVILYVVLTRFGVIWEGVRTFVGFFSPVILGAVIAYIVRPLARLYRRLFTGVRKPARRQLLANALAFITVILVLVVSLMILIPQLMESAATFVDNLDGYVASLNSLLESFGLSNSKLNLNNLISSSENLLDTVAQYLTDNIGSILASSAYAGKAVLKWVIAFLLSLYLLSARGTLKKGIGRLLRALLEEETYRRTAVVLRRCDYILNRYIAYNLLDALIVGLINAVVMAVLGLPYVALISFVVGLTNLVPTFGPVIGFVICGFLLVLVKPWYALAFLIITLVLQLADSYFIKPKLFGDSLGVSGLWILIGVIVGGRMFGIIGILLAIPAVAILDYLYSGYLLPDLEKRRQRDRTETAAEAPAGEIPPPAAPH